MAAFPPSVFDAAKEVLVQDYYMQLLNVSVPTWGADHVLLSRMLKDNILNTDGSSNLPLVRGYTFLDPFINIDQADCSSMLFTSGITGGFDEPKTITGKDYTTDICDMANLVKVACTEENAKRASTCDATLIPPVVSSQNTDVLQTTLADGYSPEPDSSRLPKLELMKTAVCMNRIIVNATVNGVFDPSLFDRSDCADYQNLPDDRDLRVTIENYWGAMLYIPPARFQYLNPLWTNTAASTSVVIDADAGFVIGDGYLQLAEEAWDALNAVPTQTNNATKAGPVPNPGAGHRDIVYARTVVVDTLVQQYTRSYTATTRDNGIFYKDMLRGYFFQRYSKSFFPHFHQRKLLIDGAVNRYSTGCAVSAGALIARYCDVVASEVAPMADALFAAFGNDSSRYCSVFPQRFIWLSKRAVVKGDSLNNFASAACLAAVQAL